ncbi:MAG: hypothetical protein AAF368_12260 [Planctomycetota bacterium]
MAQWKFRRRQGWCSGCEREFEENERHFSALILPEGADLIRVDACPTCWNERDSLLTQAAAASDEAAAVGAEAPAAQTPAEESVEETTEMNAAGADLELLWWATRHHEGKKSASLALDLDSLQKLFMTLEGREETSVLELRYILALLLLRKRRFKLERVTRGEEGEAMILRRPRKDGQEFHVRVFDFEPEQLDEMRTRLAEVLEGWTPPEDEGEDSGGEEDSAAPDEMDPDEMDSGGAESAELAGSAEAE